MMTMETTEGYTQAQLDALNAEFEARFARNDWGTKSSDTPEQWVEARAEALKWFADEVAGR